VKNMEKSKKLIIYAKQLRNNPTDAEKLLWYFLRCRYFKELKFRRQVPLGPYIVDFICFSKKLVIELDGGQHNEDKNILRDKNRDGWLENEGFAILRFWNDDVLRNIEGVLERILEKIDTLP